MPPSTNFPSAGSCANSAAFAGAFGAGAFGAAEAAHEVAEAGSAAAERAADARAELSGLGDPAALRRELDELRSRLPEEVTLGEDAPASAGVKLERAGVRVR